MIGCDGLHACCPKRDMLPNADPGELNPIDVWPNDDGWLAAAAATDPNKPLDAAVVEGEPKIDDVVQVAVGAPKIDDVPVDPEPNIELDDAEIAGLPNIVELFVEGEPNTVVVWVGEPKPTAVFVVVGDPNIDDTVVIEDVPNIDVLVFIGFPKIDDVVTEEPKIEDVVVTVVGVPNIDEVVTFVGVPKIEGVVVVFVVVPKIEEVLVGVLNIEVLVVLVCVLKIEELFVFVGVPKIEALVVFIGVLKIEFWTSVLVEFPKIPVVLVELIGVPKIEEFVDGISKIGALLVVMGVVGTFSLSGVTGSDIIGVGLSDILGEFSVTVLFIVVVGTELKTGTVLTDSKVEDIVEESTGSLITVGSEKLNEAVTTVDDVELILDLVSDTIVFEESFLVVLKLNVENVDVSGFVLKLKETSVASFVLTISCLFFDLSSVLNPENMLGVSNDLDKGFGVSKLKVVNGISFRFSILVLIESAKLNVIVFGTDISVFTVDRLEKLKGTFSFDSVIPEITSKSGFDETTFRVLLKFKGLVIDDFKLKSTGSLLDLTAEVILLPNNEAVFEELKTTGSLEKTL